MRIEKPEAQKVTITSRNYRQLDRELFEQDLKKVFSDLTADDACFGSKFEFCKITKKGFSPVTYGSLIVMRDTVSSVCFLSFDILKDTIEDSLSW